MDEEGKEVAGRKMRYIGIVAKNSFSYRAFVRKHFPFHMEVRSCVFVSTWLDGNVFETFLVTNPHHLQGFCGDRLIEIILVDGWDDLGDSKVLRELLEIYYSHGVKISKQKI